VLTLLAIAGVVAVIGNLLTLFVLCVQQQRHDRHADE
jgi:hypothetical protein